MFSIYATIWDLGFPDPQDGWPIRVTAQGVPGHVDMEADFLPPPLTDGDLEDGRLRAVVFVTDDTKKGTARAGQEYVDPLLVLSGEEYGAITFVELHRRLCDKLGIG